MNKNIPPTWTNSLLFSVGSVFAVSKLSYVAIALILMIVHLDGACRMFIVQIRYLCCTPYRDVISSHIVNGVSFASNFNTINVMGFNRAPTLNLCEYLCVVAAYNIQQNTEHRTQLTLAQFYLQQNI